MRDGFLAAKPGSLPRPLICRDPKLLPHLPAMTARGLVGNLRTRGKPPLSARATALLADNGPARYRRVEASQLEEVIEPAVGANSTNDPFSLRSGPLTSRGLSEYSIRPDLSITNLGR